MHRGPLLVLQEGSAGVQHLWWRGQYISPGTYWSCGLLTGQREGWGNPESLIAGTCRDQPCFPVGAGLWNGTKTVQPYIPLMP